MRAAVSEQVGLEEGCTERRVCARGVQFWRVGARGVQFRGGGARGVQPGLRGLQGRSAVEEGERKGRSFREVGARGVQLRKQGTRGVQVEDKVDNAEGSMLKFSSTNKIFV